MRQMYRNAQMRKELTIETMPTVNSDQFTFIPESSVMVAEVSSLPRFGKSFKVKSMRTGKVVTFDLTCEIKNSDNETDMWVFGPRERINVAIKIYND